MRFYVFFNNEEKYFETDPEFAPWVERGNSLQTRLLGDPIEIAETIIKGKPLRFEWESFDGEDTIVEIKNIIDYNIIEQIKWCPVDQYTLIHLRKLTELEELREEINAASLALDEGVNSLE